jgi:hypothetical protein
VAPVITFDEARRLATEETGLDFHDYGYEDGDDYMLVTNYFVDGLELMPVGDQPIIVSKTTGDVASLFVLENFARIDRMTKIGVHPPE